MPSRTRIGTKSGRNLDGMQWRLFLILRLHDITSAGNRNANYQFLNTLIQGFRASTKTAVLFLKQEQFQYCSKMCQNKKNTERSIASSLTERKIMHTLSFTAPTATKTKKKQINQPQGWAPPRSTTSCLPPKPSSLPLRLLLAPCSLPASLPLRFPSLLLVVAPSS